LADNDFRFHSDSIAFTQNNTIVSAPVVERVAVNFGEPIYLEIRFEKWEKREARVSLSYDRQTEPKKAFRPMFLRRTNTGSAWLAIAGSLVEIRPTGEGLTDAAIVINDAIKVGDNAEVFDATQLIDKLEK
jgi:hypothetical protein